MFKFVPKRFKSKYAIEEKVRSSGVYECSFCGNYTAFRKGELFTNCEDCAKEREEQVNYWYVTNTVVHFMSKNLNIEFEKLRGFQVNIADKIAEFAGTMQFVYFHVVWFFFWVTINLGWFGDNGVFDPFPFGLLTMIVSLEAIFLATFIMISQNIASQKSELRAEHDFQINLKTEKEVAELLTMMREMKEWQEAQGKHQDELIQGLETKKRKKRKNKILDDAGIDIVENSGT